MTAPARYRTITGRRRRRPPLWSPPGRTVDDDDREPSGAELAAIEAEWPVYAAYLAVVDAECNFVLRPDVVTRRALRRAETSLARALADHTNTHHKPTPQHQGAI